MTDNSVARIPLLLEDGLLLSPEFAKMRDYYRFAALSDGYPGRRNDDGSVSAHPIYGAYLLLGYAKALSSPLNRRDQSSYRKALRQVAEASLARMERLTEDELVFRYNDNVGLAGGRFTGSHYSALTSGYYAVAFARASRILGDPHLLAAARDIFRSLLVPEALGGVLVEHPDGPSLCETPQKPDSLILNGWLSALASILDYGEASGDSEALAFVKRSASRLEILLPKYDLPALENSRYGLTGPTRLRISSSADGTLLCEASWRIPNGDLFALQPEVSSAWKPHLEPEKLQTASDGHGWVMTERATVARVVVSLAEEGEHHFKVNIVLPARSRVRLALAKPGLDATAVTAPIIGWNEYYNEILDPGHHEIGLSFPPDALQFFVSGTAFSKRIDDKRVNVYHQIHINRLNELANRLNRPSLAQWASRWQAAQSRWGTVTAYHGLYTRVADGRILGVEEVI